MPGQGREPLFFLMTWQETITEYLPDILIGVGVFVLSLAASLGAITAVVVRLPAHYFSAKEPEPFWPNSPAWLRLVGRVGKNLLGGGLVALGAVLSLPGVPGQGLLTIFIGIILLDFPGKRRLELRIISVPAIWKASNRLRARFHRPPLLLDPPEVNTETSG